MLPEENVGVRLRERGWTVATAESCSGGLIAHRLTNVAGASSYFLGGVVAYANAVKESALGVRPESLRDHGAVSEAVAREMAEGVRRRFGVDVAVAVTGIAGPDGGTAEKPVGLVHMAVAGPSGTRAEHRVFAGDRDAIKRQAAERALEMLLECLA